MTGATWCGIDVGTQGVRVSLVSDSGVLLGEGAASLPAGRRSGNRHEQDPDAWWAGLVTAVRRALAEAPSARIAGVALDATSGTVLVEHDDGRPSGPALMYDDARAIAQAETVRRRGAARWDALGYRVQSSWALPRLLWLIEAGALGAGDRVVHQGDHLNRRLVGHRVATDTATALKTGVDLRRADWDDDVLDALGISRAVLPEVVLPGRMLGRISAEAAGMTGLPAGAPVRAGMTDGCAAQIAAGALDESTWSSALGTTLVVKGTTAELLRDPDGVVYSHRHPDGGWLPGGASSTGAGALADALPGRDLDELTRRAAQVTGIPGPVYPRTGPGERFPFAAAGAHGLMPDAWIAAHRDPDAARFAAICLGVALVERLCYDVLAGLGASRPGTVALTGGAARNPWWNQLRADVLGTTTVRPRSPQTAVGAAVLAAAEPGHLTETARRMVHADERYDPDDARHQASGAAYTALVDALIDRGWLTAARLGSRQVSATGGQP